LLLSLSLFKYDIATSNGAALSLFLARCKASDVTIHSRQTSCGLLPLDLLLYMQPPTRSTIRITQPTATPAVVPESNCALLDEPLELLLREA
jgi:hypothetical protein